jgi:hypothetical protein
MAFCVSSRLGNLFYFNNYLQFFAVILLEPDALFLVEHALALPVFEALFLVLQALVELHAFVEQFFAVLDFDADAFVLQFLAEQSRVFEPAFASLSVLLSGQQVLFVCFDIYYSPFLFLILLFVKTCRIMHTKVKFVSHEI